jgi:predicted pyridoxine 5'-phosphate oxidase superfamily flavin-nucleotide-binding protein
VSDGESPFHAGERSAQERVGARERSERGGRRMIRDFMPEEHRQFFSALPFIAVGSLDAQGRPWASIVSGEPGFVTSPTPRSLIVGAAPPSGDPLRENLRASAALGALGIQLETRRRNRANGRVVWANERGFELHVEQSFGNCKQYIQSRTRKQHRAQGGSERTESQLTARAVALLARCDTAFVASASAEPARGGREGVDVSHRGGLPGFIHVEAGPGRTRLTLPDFYGNFMFNTLGNIEVNPRAGLLACDFENGDLLSLSGNARVIWDGPEVRRFEGAERLLQIDVELSLFLEGALGETWSKPEYARELIRT